MYKCLKYKGGAAAADADVCTDKLDCQCSECSKTTCTGKPDCPCYGCLYVRQNGETPKVDLTPDSLFDAVESNDENEIKNTLVETLKKKVIPSVKSLNMMIVRGKIDEIKPLLTLNLKYDESILYMLSIEHMDVMDLVIKHLKKRKFSLTKNPLIKAIIKYDSDFLDKILELELDSKLNLDYFLEIALNLDIRINPIENIDILCSILNLYVSKQIVPNSSLITKVLKRGHILLTEKIMEMHEIEKHYPNLINYIIKIGDIELIKTKLPEFKINNSDSYDNTLDAAIATNDLNIVKLLLEKGASPSKYSLWYALNRKSFNRELYLVVFTMVSRSKIVPDIITIEVGIINSKLTGDIGFLKDVFKLLNGNNLLKPFHDNYYADDNVAVFKPAYKNPINHDVLLMITNIIRDEIKIPLYERLLRYFIISENEYAIRRGLFNMNNKLEKPYTYHEILMTAIEEEKVESLELILNHIKKPPEETLKYLLDGIFRKPIGGGLLTTTELFMHENITISDKYMTSIINILLDFYVSLKEIPSSVVLNKAIIKGNIEIIKKIMELGTPVDNHTLIIAIKKGNIDIIKQLFMFHTFPIMKENRIFESLLNTSKEVLLFLMASGILNSPQFLYWFNTNAFLFRDRPLYQDIFPILDIYYLLNTNQGKSCKDCEDLAKKLDELCADYNSTPSPYSTHYKNVVSETTGISSDVTSIIKDYAHYFPSGKYWENKIKSMHNKYLKYKNKYLNLKKQIEIR